MSEATLPVRWTEAEFFDWLEEQEGRYDFVDGAPVAMGGSTQRHDLIVTNLIIALGNRLRGGPCRAGSPDAGVRIPRGNVRYPDVTVDCGPLRDAERVATEPRLVVEVLSPSTRAFDQGLKLEEYRSVPSLAHVLVLDQDHARGLLHTRDPEGGWTAAAHDGPDAEVRLTGLGLTLRLGEAYEGLTLRPSPRLVRVPDGETA